MPKKIFILASLSGLLAGCALQADPIPTPYPPEYIPTVVAWTMEAAGLAATQTALALPTHTATLTPFPSATFTPFPTDTPTPIPGHLRAAIQIQSPGPMSKVASPIQLRMDIISGESDLVLIELFGEDGRLLYSKLERIERRLSGTFEALKIPFEIKAAAEVGRLTISTPDRQGRLSALMSVRLLLLSSGVSEITPTGNLSEPVALFSPILGEPVGGGVLRIEGDVIPFNTRPLVFELLGADGNTIGLRILNLQSAAQQPFSTTIPFNVKDPMLARLLIRQEDDRMEGLFYAFSQEVLLNP